MGCGVLDTHGEAEASAAVIAARHAEANCWHSPATRGGVDRVDKAGDQGRRRTGEEGGRGVLGAAAFAAEVAMGRENCEDALAQMGTKSNDVAGPGMVRRTAAGSNGLWSETHSQQTWALPEMGRRNLQILQTYRRGGLGAFWRKRGNLGFPYRDVC